MGNFPHMLVILDGWGHSSHHDYNAIYQGHPEHFNYWNSYYPSTLLKASGTAVGLLKGMIGNSEVGHLTIGSGRVIKQPVTLLRDHREDGSFFKNPLLINHFENLKKTKKRLHLMGLLSNAGVHSEDEDLYALLKMAVAQGVEHIIVHPFLDGRDVPPKSAALFLTKLDYTIKNLGVGIIGTMHGRYYAMDRDNHWERIEKSYRVLTEPQTSVFPTWRQALDESYAHGITDEFFVPCALADNAFIQESDAVIFFNFRADRARELTAALVLPSFNYFPRTLLPLSWMITMTQYSPDFPVDVVLHKPIVTDTLFDCLEKADMRIFTIAETEKYAHVTYFFNGGREVIHREETRILIPSKRHYETYAPIPCMSAPQITDAILRSLTSDPHDFYLINYANADMVGHSGDFKATCQAVSCLDRELKRLYDVFIAQLNGTLYITADHGKAEDMFNPDLHQPRTAHTRNKVPFILINKSLTHTSYQLPLTELADIAPFILQRLSLPVPDVMKKVPL